MVLFAGAPLLQGRPPLLFGPRGLCFERRLFRCFGRRRVAAAPSSEGTAASETAAAAKEGAPAAVEEEDGAIGADRHAGIVAAKAARRGAKRVVMCAARRLWRLGLGAKGGETGGAAGGAHPKG